MRAEHHDGTLNSAEAFGVSWVLIDHQSRRLLEQAIAVDTLISFHVTLFLLFLSILIVASEGFIRLVLADIIFDDNVWNALDLGRRTAHNVRGKLSGFLIEYNNVLLVAELSHEVVGTVLSVRTQLLHERLELLGLIQLTEVAWLILIIALRSHKSVLLDEANGLIVPRHYLGVAQGSKS